MNAQAMTGVSSSLSPGSCAHRLSMRTRSGFGRSGNLCGYCTSMPWSSQCCRGGTVAMRACPQGQSSSVRDRLTMYCWCELQFCSSLFPRKERTKTVRFLVCCLLWTVLRKCRIKRCSKKPMLNKGEHELCESCNRKKVGQHVQWCGGGER